MTSSTQCAEALTLINPNAGWVSRELEKLYLEWIAWQEEVGKIVDRPYDRNTHSEVFADGEDMMERHAILQAKTKTFLNNNLRAHGFITYDRTDLRLRMRVRHRLLELRALRACLEYARVPDSYWKAKAKEVVDKLVDKTPEAAVRLLEGYLKNPFSTDLGNGI